MKTNKYEIELTENEFKFLTEYRNGHDGTKPFPSASYFYEKEMRCECGHLWALHNGHCCSFCMVPGCKCENKS